MMDPNRDEALRAKAFAERKFQSNDIASAKKLALKAQSLCPDLDGISQMITSLDVLLASQVVINGERDWYSVLSICASADEETVKKQYRKLALALHPDKNKSVGAEAAFKLVSEAWSTLSDGTRRMAYDQKRNLVHMSRQNGASRSHVSSNGFCQFPSSGAASNLMAKKNNARTGSSVAHPYYPPPRPDTFWTSCSRCRMQYEYLRIYLNHNLLCPSCHGPFFAVETGYPINGYATSANCSSQRQQNPSVTRKSYPHKHSAASVSAQGSGDFQHCPDLTSNGTKFSSTPESFKTKAADQTEKSKQQNYGKRTANLNGGLCNGLHTVSSHPDEPGKKRRRLNEDGGDNYRGHNVAGHNVANCEEKNSYSNAVAKTEKLNGVLLDSRKARILERQSSMVRRELSSFDVRNMLMKKAKLLIQMTLNDWKSAVAAKALGNQQKKHNQKEKRSIVTSHDKKITACEDKHETADSDKLGNILNPVTEKKADSESSVVNSSLEVQQTISIDVPDPDFHDFDKDRSEICFEADQVWAVYDDEDGMPRYYALVQKVICLEPFKIRMSYLKSKTNSELGHLNWVSMGFAKTAGDFRVGKYEIKDSINIFSHKVRWEKGARGVIRIFPLKGEVWALYRNWSPQWNEHTSDDVIYKYDMVEILDEYNEEQGIAVVPLIKVAGFRTIFCRHEDPNEVRRVPRQEMFRFSHQVPSYLLTGSEGQHVPKGCLELDPAATPMEFLHKITENEETKVIQASAQQ